MLTLKAISPTILLGLFIQAFFILFLHFKWSYTLFALLASLIGVISFFIERQKKAGRPSTLFSDFRQEKILIFTLVGYFIFLLISLLIHQDRLRELDIPSKMLLLLPTLAAFRYIRLPVSRLANGIFVASLIAAVVGCVQVFILGYDVSFPQVMRIQSGDVAMTMSLFGGAFCCYFYAQKQPKTALIAAVACGAALLASLTTGARGAWVALPLFGLILFFYRRLLSKFVAVGLIFAALIGGIFAGTLVEKRFDEAKQDIVLYLDNTNTETSLGARFDMWKSALLGVAEKPLIGWGQAGVKEMRQQHFDQGLISAYAAQFSHSHNQYLHEAAVHGIFGLLALLAFFLVPLRLFWTGLRQASNSSAAYLYGVLGVSHILATMGYCLSQAFFAHNSGMIFYVFVLLVLLGLQKQAVGKEE